MEITFNKERFYIVENRITPITVKQEVQKQFGIPINSFYLISNGKRLENDSVISANTIHVYPKVLGGKGGFGSMLRAIGAQIEKTTNREACRDLSGRRLRDINEEQRLKNWIAAQAEREKEAADRKQKKLERLCERPKHVFQDESYDKERSALPEKVEDAVEQGFKAAGSSGKRKSEVKSVVKKKKPKLWVDADVEDELSSSEGEDSDSSDSKASISNSVSCSGVSHDENTSEGVKKVDDDSKEKAAKIEDKEEGKSDGINDKKGVDDVNKND